MLEERERMMLQEKKHMLEERNSIPRRGGAGPGDEKACSREETHAPGRKHAWERKSMLQGRKHILQERKHIASYGTS